MLHIFSIYVVLFDTDSSIEKVKIIMKKSNFIIELVLLQLLLIFFIGQNIFAAPERPSDANLMAFKVYCLVPGYIPN